MARNFFINQENIIDSKIYFIEEDNQHLISLRKNSGDIIDCILLKRINLQPEADIVQYKVCLQKRGNKYLGEIVNKKIIPLEHNKKVSILQCIPKLDKMDYIIQKCSELNAYSIIPLFSTNSDIKKEIGANKLSRWNRIARESSMQSGRRDIIDIQNPQKLNEYLIKNKSSLLNLSTINLVLSELENEKTLRDISGDIKNKGISNIQILIGPEGGFDKREIDNIVKNFKFIPLSLGKNILRTETAGITALSIVQYILGNI